MLHSCSPLLFYLLICGFILAIASANCVKELLDLRTIQSSQFLNWDITLLHTQSSATGWRLRSRVKERNGTQCLLLSSPPPSAPPPFPLSFMSFRHPPTFTLLTPLVPYLSFIRRVFGNWKASTASTLLLHLPFIFLSRSLSVSLPSLVSPRHSNHFKQLRGICWSSCCSCWSNKDPSEW